MSATALVALRSGKLMDLLNPKPEDIDIVEISSALGMICRFGGRGDKFYSVAEHSCILSDWMIEQGLSGFYALCALMHDASEAYVGDMIGPLKPHLPEFKRVEKRVWSVIASKYQLPVNLSPIIKDADTRLGVTEIMELIPQFDAGEFYPGIEPLYPRLSFRMKFWGVKTAAYQFYDRFQDLYHHHKRERASQ